MDSDNDAQSGGRKTCNIATHGFGTLVFVRDAVVGKGKEWLLPVSFFWETAFFYEWEYSRLIFSMIRGLFL